MTQVWLLDKENYFTGESIFVEEVSENMTTEPLLVGYIKAKWTGSEWVEGATQEELKEWEAAQPKPFYSLTPEQMLTKLIIESL